MHSHPLVHSQMSATTKLGTGLSLDPRTQCSSPKMCSKGTTTPPDPYRLAGRTAAGSWHQSQVELRLTQALRHPTSFSTIRSVTSLLDIEFLLSASVYVSSSDKWPGFRPLVSSFPAVLVTFYQFGSTAHCPNPSLVVALPKVLLSNGGQILNLGCDHLVSCGFLYKMITPPHTHTPDPTYTQKMNTHKSYIASFDNSKLMISYIDHKDTFTIHSVSRISSTCH